MILFLYLIKLWIPIPRRNCCVPYITTSLLLLVLIQSLSTDQVQTMKVHPAPKKRNITIRYDVTSSRLMGGSNHHKKLRRLPHIFSRVLELPFRSDADVSIQETSDCFRFVAETDDIEGVRAHAIQIHPGVTKVVIRGSDVLELGLDELELDVWRFRLPASTRPEMASAVYVGGELIVTVPKGEGLENSEDGEVWGGMGRLVLVQ